MSSAAGAERRGPTNRRAPSNFFTIARFEPDTLALFAFLVAAAVVLLLCDLPYLSCVIAGALGAIFLVESFETVSLDQVECRQIVGARCLVLRQVSATERGIARLFRADGRLDPELWSVEASSPISEGETALVSGMRSVILDVAPMPGTGVDATIPFPLTSSATE